mmetsp:Transcript_20050/g.76870  ORF Transcript_20050/g.76870 Transcript_20050/m.76870 type:complete len:589 (+) Transcript_20050:520-2286(+)
MRVSLSVLHRRLPPGRGRFRRILAKSERGSGSRHLRRCLSNTQGAVWVQSLRRRGSSHGRRPRSNVAERWEAHWLSVGVEGAVGVWQADAGAPGRQLLPGIDVVVVVGVLAGRLVVLASPGERPTGSTAAVFVVITVLLVVLVVLLLLVVVVVVPVAQPKLVVNCRNRCKVHKVREPVRGDDICLLGNKPVTRPDLEAEPSQLQVLPPQHRGVKHPTVLQLHVLELQHAHPVLQVQQVPSLAGAGVSLDVRAQLLGLALILLEPSEQVSLRLTVRGHSCAKLFNGRPSSCFVPAVACGCARIGGAVHLRRVLGPCRVELLAADLRSVLRVDRLEVDERAPQLHPLAEVSHKPPAQLLGAVPTIGCPHATGWVLPGRARAQGSWRRGCWRPQRPACHGTRAETHHLTDAPVRRCRATCGWVAAFSVALLSDAVLQSCNFAPQVADELLVLADVVVDAEHVACHLGLDFLGSVGVLERVEGFLEGARGGADGRDHDGAAIAPEAVLQQASQLGVAVGDIGPLASGSKRIDDVAQREQRAVDVGALAQSNAAVLRVGRPLRSRQVEHCELTDAHLVPSELLLLDDDLQHGV